ncbi:hypothetical protein DM02DRAFT_684370 [Periconia macrospinosa]|uniref:Wax synthase domain-containing protein n=1 Tax=Periconia macrospinosa TaxID=97972 RepID=A0A2V1DIG4_9PLEO|nr:hypothetical protein DM02DRAFT_684370 [Periconia macrospinosa]
MSPDDTLNEIYTRFILIGGSHILHMAYNSKGSNGGLKHMDHLDAKPDWSPWYRGWKLIMNPRGVGCPWETPNMWPGLRYTWEARTFTSSISKTTTTTPTPSYKDRKPPSSNTANPPRLFKQSRWAGVATRIGYFTLHFVLLSLAYEFLSPEVLFGISPINPSTDYTRAKEGMLRRLILQLFQGSSAQPLPVTKRELQIRAFLALEYVTGDFLLLSLYTDFFAICWLTLHLDEPWEFPPFYGNILEAYSMRHFWGKFWHRVIYRSFNAHAAIISRYVLRLRQRTQVTRVVNGLLVFGLSAVMHALVSVRLGNRCAWGRSMWYWMWQPVAFVLEDFVQGVWGKCRGRVAGWIGARGVKVLERGVGYVWVMSWLVWEAPKREFALANCEA